jgi:hypothetical protein
MKFIIYYSFLCLVGINGDCYDRYLVKTWGNDPKCKD